MRKIISFIFATLAIQIAVSQSVQLNIKVFIEGPYYNGQMTPFLNVLGYLPTDQPYNMAPWNYPGTESVTEFPSSNIVDWVLVDVLKQHTDGDQIKFELIGRKAGFLFKTGLIKDIDGISNLIVESNINSGFYVRIHHRNHLSVISAVPLVESGGVFTYDFSIPAGQAMGGSLSQKQLSSVIWGMIAADANASGQIDNRDKNDVWLPQQNLTGYYEGDFNMDTQVDMDDKIVKWQPNAGKSSYPVRDTIIPLFICGSSSVMFNGLEYGTVKFNNKCWFDRNLGASQVATAYNDPLSYGELFQWGRLIDGHQIRTSATTNVLANSDVPGHGDFIITDDDPYDWRNPQNDNLWQETANINNPCPDGWNIPSLTQWQEATTGWTNRTDAFNSLLKLTAAGWRSESAGNLSNVGSWGNYWTTAVNATGTRGVQFDSFNFSTGTYARASGRSVRCLKTDYVPNNPPSEPSDPNPANGATGVETNINLSWVCSDPDGDDLTYNIYFGTTMVPPLVVTNNTGNTWNPGLLNLSTTYYWKIVAYDIYGDSTQSFVWNFTTKIPFDCGDILIDTRDGQTYNTVQIGEQCWMAENLNIGTMIPGANNMANDGIIEKYCYDNNTSNCDTYGGMYQWNEVMQYTTQEGTIGLCPAGWHIPTDAEFFTLTDFLGGENIAGGKMKTTGTIEEGTGLWYSPNTGATNLSGFSLLPLGFRSSGIFGNLGISATIWSSTEESSANAWARSFFHYDATAYHHFGSKISGEPVRCIKNSPPPTWSCGDPFNDTRDGQTYNTVQIGEQCWMAENLNIGNMIQGENEMTNDEVIEKYCYDNNVVNCDNKGGLYQWDELMQYSTQQGSQGICPTGWHVPTDAEWKILEGYADSQYGIGSPEWDIENDWRGFDAGLNLKSQNGWILNGNGTDLYGFTVSPSGFRNDDGIFLGLTDICHLWTSTLQQGNISYKRSFDPYYNESGRFTTDNILGWPTRCLKDSPPPTWSCGNPLNDTRDGQTYNTVQIGDQCWMEENLNIGTMINSTTEMSNDNIIEKYCDNNSTTNCSTYGGLYQWNEVMQYDISPGGQGICPTNWHIPTDADWCTLTQFIDPTVNCNTSGWSGTDAGTKMKSTTGWDSGGNGTNESGFDALPGGNRYDGGDFGNLGGTAGFWTSTEGNAAYAWYRLLSYLSTNINRFNYDKNYGFSVRCVND